MKKSLMLVTALFMVFSAGAQISLEKTFTESAWVTTLANSGFKYYSMDVVNNQCKIYNSDYTLWKTIPLSVPAGYTLYDVQYVSQNLFSTDGMVGLAYMYYSYNSTLQYYTYEVRIIKENGTVLLTVPNAAYMYVATTGNGSAKFFTYRYDYAVSPYFLGTNIYSIPGLFVGINDTPGKEPERNSHPFPNPSSTYVTIPVPKDGSNSAGKITVTDFHGRVIIDQPLDATRTDFRLNTSSFPSGTYICTIQKEGQVIQTEKFVVRR